MEREFGISRCKLVYREWINNKVLLYSTGNYIQYPGINQNRKTILISIEKLQEPLPNICLNSYVSMGSLAHKSGLDRPKLTLLKPVNMSKRNELKNFFTLYYS